MANVAGKTFLRDKIGIVLRRGRLEHWRAEIWCVAEVLRKGVVREEGPAVRKTSPDVNVTGLIPALRGVFQKIDATHGKRRVGYGDVGRQNHTRQETQSLEWPAWANGPRAGGSVI